jgi:hypothetical protein
MFGIGLGELLLVCVLGVAAVVVWRLLLRH